MLIIAVAREAAARGERGRDGGMRRGRRGHPCEPDASRLGPWFCPECGQEWEIHGVAGGRPKVRRVSRVAKFVATWLGG
ncbi:hypothetical protein [Saccharopolyspora gregorii]|nr:hypothetical protein [Saccharopolyspora gregorii]